MDGWWQLGEGSGYNGSDFAGLRPLSKQKGQLIRKSAKARNALWAHSKTDLYRRLLQFIAKNNSSTAIFFAIKP